MSYKDPEDAQDLYHLQNPSTRGLRAVYDINQDLHGTLLNLFLRFPIGIIRLKVQFKVLRNFSTSFINYLFKYHKITGYNPGYIKENRLKTTN